MKALPDREREVLVLRYLERLDTEETAAVLQTTVGTVKGLHRRALLLLRRIVDEPEEGSS